jgi:hypothetical protein
MKQDRFLVIILVLIGLLVVAALGLFFLRKDNQSYTSATTPSGVARNFVIALQEGDTQRAYSYLAEYRDKPEYDQFRQALQIRQLELNSTAVQLGSETQNGDEAVVKLILVRSGGGPFGEVFRQPETALLERDASGAWKITRFPYPFWDYGWEKD